jgi:uncharacterized membrane protein
MGHTIKLYLLVLIIFLAIDLTWLGVLMAKFYKTELGPLADIAWGGFICAVTSYIAVLLDRWLA